MADNHKPRYVGVRIVQVLTAPLGILCEAFDGLSAGLKIVLRLFRRHFWLLLLIFLSVSFFVYTKIGKPALVFCLAPDSDVIIEEGSTPAAFGIGFVNYCVLFLFPLGYCFVLLFAVLFFGHVISRLTDTIWYGVSNGILKVLSKSGAYNTGDAVRKAYDKQKAAREQAMRAYMRGPNFHSFSGKDRLDWRSSNTR